MSTPNKRRGAMDDNNGPKRVRKECSYGEKCYRKNPAHLREYSHPHLESILDEYNGDGSFPIPARFGPQRHMIGEQLQVMLEKKVYEPGKKIGEVSSSTGDIESKPTSTQQIQPNPTTNRNQSPNQIVASGSNSSRESPNLLSASSTPRTQSPNPRVVPSRHSPSISTANGTPRNNSPNPSSNSSRESPSTSSSTSKMAAVTGDLNAPSGQVKRSDCKVLDAHYRPMVPPKRRAEEFLKVVHPRGNMAAKHAASAPYHIFYTTITDARETHDQPYSITFLEILDSSLGELKCSLQINFMVEPGWLLAQYYFAGYSEKRLTILYGDQSDDMRTLGQKKPHVDAHHVQMPTPFGTHHTKMMILCYEDGSLRVVVSTANLYVDDWKNRTQGLWFSPSCPELPPDAMPHDGESPTMFKRTLLRYLNHYHLPCLAFYMERVKRCDFSHINVFLVASIPGSHFDMDWGLMRAGSLLKQHCLIPASENSRWPLLAQASSLGSFGKEPKVWLTGDFLHHFTKIKSPPQVLSPPAELKLIYPSLENVRQSHDDLLGGGCLPYGANVHTKQLWLNDYLYQWKATHTSRNKAMPHIKSYTRISPDCARAAYFLLTSANVSKAAWGAVNKKDGALRLLSCEAGVLFLPRFVINEDFFLLQPGNKNRLIIPYDIPPTKYTADMSAWVSDYLR